MQKGVLDDVAPRRRPVLDARQEAKALGFWRTAACRSGVWLVGSLVWAAGRCRELAVRRCGWPGCGPARARGPIGCSMISSPGLFVSAGGGEVTEAVAAPPGTSEFLGIGTRFFDDQARAACTAGVRQVVLFAAGLDPGVPTGWLAEGLLPYLPGVDGDRLLSTVTLLSAPGSRVTFDHLEATAADRPAMRATSDAVSQMGAQLIPAADSLADWLAEHGWQASFFRVPALGEGYGRPLPADADVVASNAAVLITARR